MLSEWAKLPGISAQQIHSYGAVARALKKGKLKKPETCSQCGRKRPLNAHHYKGYVAANRLEIVWLCSQCHGKAHSRPNGHRWGYLKYGKSCYATARLSDEMYAQLKAAASIARRSTSQVIEFALEKYLEEAPKK